MAHDKKSKRKNAKAEGAIRGDVELPLPVNQNAAATAKLGPHPRSHMNVPEPKGRQRGQQATSLAGDMGIIQDVMRPGRGIHGIPGIISSTTVGPEQRERLVSGIIVSAMGGHMDQGPVTRVTGHDSTAWNAGMAHIPGSHFR